MANSNYKHKQTRNLTIQGEKNMNFGNLYDIFENNTENLIKTQKGRKTIAEVINTIKNDKTLLAEHALYASLKNISKSLNDKVGAKKYVEKIMESVNTIPIKAINESNDKLMRIIQKNGMDEEINIDDETSKTYEAIEYVLTHKKNVTNTAGILDAMDTIEENLKRNIVDDTKEEQDLDETILDLKNRYKYALNEDERKIIDTLTETGNMEQSFNNYRNKILDKINETANSENNTSVKNGLRDAAKTIETMRYSRQTAVDDMIKLMKVEEKLDE